MSNYFRSRLLITMLFFVLCCLMSGVFIYTTYSVPEIDFLFHDDNLVMLVALTLLTTIYSIAFFHMLKGFEIGDFARAIVAFPIGFLIGIVTNTGLNIAIGFLSEFAS